MLSAMLQNAAALNQNKSASTVVHEAKEIIYNAKMLQFSALEFYLLEQTYWFGTGALPFTVGFPQI